MTIENCIIRFNEMEPCKTAFIDARTPGSDKKENFCLIGEGVAENPDQIVHIDVPHGFNVGAARQPKGCKNSHHSHDTEEVFMIHSGEWQFTWGEAGTDGQTILREGDVISLPSNMFRGFENVGDEEAFMYAILGLNQNGSAGRVIWAPYVFEQAEGNGLVLLDDGRLIDTAAGVSIPANSIVTQATTADEAAKLKSPSTEQMNQCVMRASSVEELEHTNLSKIKGVSEQAIIGIENTSEEVSGAHIDKKHGFHLRQLELQSGAEIPLHSRQEEEVVIVHKGSLEIQIDDVVTVLNQGDLLTAPIGRERRYCNTSADLTQAWVIRRGDQPSAAKFS